MSDLEFPRAIYKGEDWNGVPDATHEAGRAESQDDFDAKAKLGWRLTPNGTPTAAAPATGKGKLKPVDSQA